MRHLQCARLRPRNDRPGRPALALPRLLPEVLDTIDTLRRKAVLARQ